MLPRGARAPALRCALSQSPETAAAHLGKGYDALRLDLSLVMRARFPLAAALFELKQSAGAVRYLTKAMARSPFPDTAYYLGLACFKQGNLARAEKWLRQAADVNRAIIRARDQLGMVYRKLGREEQSRQTLAESADLRHRDTDESEMRTACAQKLDAGPRAEARAFCQRLYAANDAERLTALGAIAERAPGRPPMQYNLAYTYYRRGRYADARGLKRAHELNRQDPAAADLLFHAALVVARKSQAAREYADALRYFAEAARLRPADREPHPGLAAIYALTGHSDEAAAEQRLASHAQ